MTCHGADPGHELADDVSGAALEILLGVSRDGSSAAHRFRIAGGSVLSTTEIDTAIAFGTIVTSVLGGNADGQARAQQAWQSPMLRNRAVLTRLTAKARVGAPEDRALAHPTG